jgi:hypothetical protein
VAGFEVSNTDFDYFETDNRSIYVINGVGSRFFGNFNTNLMGYPIAGIKIGHMN